MYYIYLPKNMKPSKEVFEKVGFTFEDVGDSVLCRATLPDRWELKSETTSKSLIIDEKGQKRGYSEFHTKYIIGKGCVETAGFMVLTPKFKIMLDDLDGSTVLCIKDKSVNKIIYVAGICNSTFSTNYTSLYKNCTDYLNEHFPDWEDVTKYWD